MSDIDYTPDTPASRYCRELARDLQDHVRRVYPVGHDVFAAEFANGWIARYRCFPVVPGSPGHESPTWIQWFETHYGHVMIDDLVDPRAPT